MDKEELARRLRETFQQELRDHVDSLNRELLALESEQSDDERSNSWQTIFRVAHTLKGASGIVNIDSIRDSCHAMEEIFGHFRDNDFAMPDDTTSLMLKTADRFAEISHQMQRGEEVDESVLDDVLPTLKEIANDVRNQKQQGSRTKKPPACERVGRRPPLRVGALGRGGIRRTLSGRPRPTLPGGE